MMHCIFLDRGVAYLVCILSSLPFYSLISLSFLVPVIADLYPCIKDHATHTKSRGLMSLPLIRSASRPLMRRAKGPSLMFTHSPPRVLLQPLWKVQRQPFLVSFCVSLYPKCGSALFISTLTYRHRCALLLTLDEPIWLASDWDQTTHLSPSVRHRESGLLSAVL